MYLLGLSLIMGVTLSVGLFLFFKKRNYRHSMMTFLLSLVASVGCVYISDIDIPFIAIGFIASVMFGMSTRYVQLGL